MEKKPKKTTTTKTVPKTTHTTTHATHTTTHPTHTATHPTHPTHTTTAATTNTTNVNLDSIPICSIDPEGVFKYVQIQCNGKIYVRGRIKCKYHKGVYKTFLAELAAINMSQLKTKVLGGGRMEVNPNEKKISVYGFSNAYGRYDGQHAKTCELLKVVYPDYNITWADSGY